jgi:hypothetical protein
VSDSYLGAAEGGRPGAPLARRLRACSDQRRLFPHRRPLQLTAYTLVLGGWRVIRRQAVASVRLTFTDGYRRSQAAGIGGNNASFAPLPGAVWMIRAAVEGTPTTRAVTRILITCPAPPMPCGMAATRFAGSPTAGDSQATFHISGHCAVTTRSVQQVAE